MTTTEFPTQIVDIDYSRAPNGDYTWMTATARADGQHWTVSMRIPDDDPEGAATRKKLGLAIIAGVQNLHARPCDTKGCDRKAFNHGDVRANGEVKHVSVCEPCKNAITASATDGPMSVLLMPFFAFAEYDV